MIVRNLHELPEDQVVSGDTWTSRRLLLREAGMGFSLHDTIIRARTSTPIHYKNHLEAVYCVRGRGEVEIVETGERFPIQPGTVYALDANDQHVLHAEETMQMVCVFNPPLVGSETHDASGAYPRAEPADESPTS